MKINSNNDIIYVDKSGSTTKIIKYKPGFELDGNPYRVIIDNTISALIGQDIKAVTENNNGELFFVTNSQKLCMLPKKYVDWKSDTENVQDNEYLMRTIIHGTIYSTVMDVTTNDNGDVYILELDTNPDPDQYLIRMLPEGFFRDYHTWNLLSLKIITDTVQEPIASINGINDFYVTAQGDIYFISKPDDMLISYPWARTEVLCVDSDRDRLLDGFHKYYTTTPTDHEKIMIRKFERNNIAGIESENADVDSENYIMENLVSSHTGKLFFGELSNYDIYENAFSTSSPYRDTVYTTVHSNPLNFNTDGDGLSDGTEMQGISIRWIDYIKYETYILSPYAPPTDHEYHTYSDPSRIDTDDDSIVDHIEWGFTDIGDQDTDADGINDNDEDKNRNGEFDVGETNPINQDTDGDFLCDGWNDEDDDGVWDYDDATTPNYNEYGEYHEFSGPTLDPLVPDTDGDEIPDGIEFAFLTKRYGGLEHGYKDTDGNGTIDMFQVDSDNDGLTDGEENFVVNNIIDQSTAANPYTHGLLAEYFTLDGSNDFKDLEGYEIVSDIDFDWGDDGPEQVSDDNSFGIRYTGYVYVDYDDPVDGYRFRLKGNGMLSLKIDDNPAVTAGTDSSGNTNVVEIWFGDNCPNDPLDRGLHEVTIEFKETTSEANVTFEWFMGYVTGPFYKPVSEKYLFTPYSGLFGEYYDGDIFTNPPPHASTPLAYTQVDDLPINYEWGDPDINPGDPGCPPDISDEDDFSIRWTGKIYIPFEEDITFKLWAQGKAKLTIDSTEVCYIDTDPSDEEGDEDTGTINKKVNYYEIVVEFVEDRYEAGIKLYWSSQSISNNDYKLVTPENLVVSNTTCFHGSVGYYYVDDFSGDPKNQRVDDERGILGPIDYKWYDGVYEGPGIPYGTNIPSDKKDSFSVQWRGELFVPKDKDITIKVKAQGKFRVFIEGTKEIEKTTEPSGSGWYEKSATFTQAGGNRLATGYNEIEVHFRETYTDSHAGIQLLWDCGGQMEVIPRTYLHVIYTSTALGDNVKHYIETDPSDSDSDDDGLLDGAEPAWKEDNDKDGFINAWDQDSNDQIANPNEEGEYDMNSTSRLDYAQNYVVFRMGGRSGTAIIDFDDYTTTGTWVAVDPKAANWDDEPTYDGVNLYWNEYLDDYNLEPNPKDDPLNLKVYTLSATEPVVYGTVQSLGLKDMKVSYGDPYDQDTVEDEDVKTPDGKRVFKDGSSDIIYVELIGNSKYAKFVNPSDGGGGIDENIRSEPLLPAGGTAKNYDPNGNPPFNTFSNFVVKNQEYYDPRPALNLDSDFDGLENGVEIMFGSNPNDADTDNDGIKDGKELFWNKDIDRDGKWERNLWMGRDESGKWIGNYYNTGINLLDPDSDNDGIPDGTEQGVAMGHPHTYGNKITYTTFPTLVNDNDIMYEYPVIFYDPDNYDPDPSQQDTQYWLAVDEDTGNTTDPLDSDTDDDGIPDGWDDTDGDGVKDADEARGEDFNVSNAGSYTYILEHKDDVDKDYLCCNGKVDYLLTDSNPDNDEPDPLDQDSDDDGRIDGDEGDDSGGNKQMEWYADMDSDGVHNAYDIDSDGDMVMDGLELGMTEADVNPEHTNLTVFRADANPGITTEPLDEDTDGDGLYDGYYDEDGDGDYDAFELGEDTDCDGAIKNDLNGDGVMDLIDPMKDQESKAGQGESSEAWEETHPNDVDSDKDGLYDGFDIIVSGLIQHPGELSRHNLAISDKLIPVNQDYYGDDVQKRPTDPLNPDTDGDMLWDWEDITDGGVVIHKGEFDSNNLYQNQVESLDYHARWQDTSEDKFTLPSQEYYTDPSVMDCDEDGLIDGFEVFGWKINITNGKTLEIVEEHKNGRQVYSNPWVKDTDGDNDDNSEFNLTDYDEWSYRSNASHVDSDDDCIPDWNENQTTLTVIEAEDPTMGDIEGKVRIEWYCVDVPLVGKVPLYPQEFYLELSIPVEDNAGLEKIRIWVDDKQMPTIYLNGVKKTTVKATYHASAFKAIFNGYDVEANVTDVNGNYKYGEAHIDGALEGLLKILLAFIIAAILLALAFLGSWIIPIIMAACAVTIVISVAVIISNWNEWTNNVKDTINIQAKNLERGGEVDFTAIFDAIFESTMIIAFTSLFIAIDVLYLCLKAYLSVGGWVLDNAKSLAIDLVVMAIVGALASSFSYINDIKNGKGIGEIIIEFFDSNQENQDTKGDSLDFIIGSVGLIFDIIGMGIAAYEKFVAKVEKTSKPLILAIIALSLSSTSLLWSVYNLPGGIYVSEITAILGLFFAFLGLQDAIIGELEKDSKKSKGVSKYIKWFLTLSSVCLASYSFYQFYTATQKEDTYRDD